MARNRTIQNSLITGALSPTLLGRVDLEKYYNAVEEAENVVIMPHGGMERRPGLKLIDSVATGSRLFSFEFSLTQTYILVFSTTEFNVYKPDDATIYETLDYTTEGLADLTTTQLNEMDIIQSADTIIITHEDFKPIEIKRTSDTVWTINYISLQNIPKYDYTSANTPTYFNYGSSVLFSVLANEITYNNDNNSQNGLNKHLYKAELDSTDTDFSTVDFTQRQRDYENDGSTNNQTVLIGETVWNNDGDAINGATDTLYKANNNRGTIDLSLEDFSNATNWSSLGKRFENSGGSKTVTVEIGEVVWHTDVNSSNGIYLHAYRAITQRASIDLSTEVYTNTNNWADNNLWIDLDEREDVWSIAKGWPRTCTFHQGRLWFGGSKSKPTSVWGSVVNDYYNFDTGGGDVQADDAIFDILDTEQYNAIENIISGTNLQVLTASGEFVNTSDVITPTTSGWKRHTSYGAKRVKPVTLDGSTYFMDRFGKTLRGFIYDDSTASYTTPPISILSEHLINGVVDLDIIRGSSTSVSNLVYLVNNDGTVAVFNTMRQENISGWTKWTTNGNFKRVTTTGDIVTFIVERDGTEYLEVLDSDVLLDHAFIEDLSPADDRIVTDQVLYDNEIRVVADGIVQTSTAGILDTGTYYAVADRDADQIYAGLNYDVTIKTLPVVLNTKSEGNIVNLPRRITRCILNLYQSRGVYVNGNLVTNRHFGDATDTAFPLITGTESVYLLGYNTKQQITISQSNPDPMTVLAVDLEISY